MFYRHHTNDRTVTMTVYTVHANYMRQTVAAVLSLLSQLLIIQTHVTDVYCEMNLQKLWRAVEQPSSWSATRWH